jgi:hypothetical protein
MRQVQLIKHVYLIKHVVLTGKRMQLCVRYKVKTTISVLYKNSSHTSFEQMNP